MRSTGDLTPPAVSALRLASVLKALAMVNGRVDAGMSRRDTFQPNRTVTHSTTTG
jgi:hypothetical protein